MMKPSRTTRLLGNELAKKYLPSAGAATKQNRMKANRLG
jgi:hypothetical protein